MMRKRGISNMCGPVERDWEDIYKPRIIEVKPLKFPTPEEVEANRLKELQPKVDSIRKYMIDNLNKGMTTMLQPNSCDLNALGILIEEAKRSGWVITTSEDQRDCQTWWYFKKASK